MDPAPSHLDQQTSPERHISPESSSIRPNPFDDTDASSRKRRRTSASASLSPVTPTDAGGSFDAADATAEGASTNSDSGPTLTENILKEAPSTPEQQSNGSGPNDPPSSQVTINIRRRSRGENKEPSTNSINDFQNDMESNMTAPVRDMGSAQALGNENDIPQGEHVGASLDSPPTTKADSPDEENPEGDDDDDDEDDEDDDEDDDDDMIITSVHEKTPSPVNVNDLVELTDQFPFREPGEDIMETLHRIVQYLSSQPAINDTIPEQLSTWIKLCVKHMERSDPADIIVSIKSQELFWLAFPSIMIAIRNRISAIASSQALSYIVIDLLSAFAKLAGQILRMDSLILSLVNSDQDSNTAELTLFCTEYLNQLHDVMQIGDLFVPGKDEAEEVSPIWNHASMVRALLLPLETVPGNLTGWMEPFITHLNAVVAQSKSHSVTLTALTQMMADCLRESSRRLSMSGITPNVQSQIKDNLQRGQSHWQALSDTFGHLIEKHISILNPDTAFAFLDGLTTMLEYCSPFDTAFLEDHMQLHPDTPVASLAEAAAWEFRLQIFAKLIQSSQMQLRVKAVSALCGDLIRIWKRRSDKDDRDTAEFLRYLGARLDDKVVDYVIGPTCHPEIIIESANVLGFLVVTKTYSQRHTDRLWAAILSSQDPRVGDALTRMVLTVCSLLEYETLLELCIKFQQLPLEDFSSTLRSLWESIIRELVAKRQGTQIPLTREPFFSCLRILRESTRAIPGARVAHVELHQSAAQRLKELLLYGIDQPVRQELYEACIEDLRAKTDKTLGSLWFLSMSIRPGISAELQKLIEEYDLARLLVEELDCAMQKLASTERPVFSGHANHPRRDLIYNLIHIQPAAISSELSTKLWDLLVGALSQNTEDRVAAWQMLATVGRNSDYQNLFLQACFSQFLPKLPATCFSEGMLEIVKDNVSQLVNDPTVSILEDEELVSTSPIEHLWRIVLMGEDDSMVSSAIRALASNVYLESRAIATLPSQRAQEIHVRLADRCLKLMDTAAKTLRSINDGSPSGDDESMVFIASEEDTKTQERVFIRSLGILRFFMEAYRAKPQFSMPDMRSLIPQSTSEVKGDLAGLQYQSFDGNKQTDIKPLEIGKQNSAGCLLARLRHETGFDNYRAFYRGQHFLPNGNDICKSLEELQVNDGLILVKRAASDFVMPPRIRAGLSPLEIKILSHFNDLWEYLGMDEKLAKEVYIFLLKVPADGGTMDLFDNTAMDYGAIFAPDQPYKTLYTIHAMIEYTATARSSDYGRDNASEISEPASKKHSLALRRALQLLVHALEDQDLAKNAPIHLQMQISCESMMTFTRLLRDAQVKWGSLKQSNISGPSPQRLNSILQDALDSSSEEAVEWVASTLAAILRLSADDQDYWLTIKENATFADLLCRICVFDSRHRVRMIAIAMIEETAASECQVKDENKAVAPNDTAYLSRFLWSLTLEVLPKAIRLGAQCQELLRLMQTLTTRLSCINQVPLSLKPFAIQLVELLLNHTVAEDISELTPCDTVACGLVALLDLCAQIDNALPVSLPWELLQSLLESTLFPRTLTRKEVGVPKIILNSNTRQKLYEFILQHVRYDSSSLQATLGFLNNLTPFYPNDDEEPYIYDLPFQFDQARAIRAPCGYVGLRNLSNTCYLNSLLTQLYMNTEFRRFLLSFEVQDSEGSQKLLFSTQNLFGYLQDSYQRFVDTTSLVKTIKTYDDTMIDIHSQMDVDEFYNLLFDRWEGQLPNGIPRKKLRSFYGGQLVQQVKSKECDHISERLEPFSAIQCDIKGKATLQDSLQAYVDGEIMDGDNKYKCSSCDNHVDAVKRACLKDIPDNMIFHLKRFDFNLRTLQRSKINDHFAFPETIDLQPYTIDFLSGESGARDKQDVFELVGVLVHSGTAESGHYYSYIRERPSQRNPSRWIEFNDDLVSPWDPGMLEESTFGGTDRSAIYDANGIVYDKTYSAYMLFYQRATSLRSQEETLPSSSILAPLRVEMNAALQQHIRDENVLLLRRHCLFDQSHTRFVQACIGEATNPQERLATECEEKEKQPRVSHNLAVEVAVGHLDQVVSRAKDVPLFADYTSLVHSQIERCDDCALNFFVYFSERPAALRSLVQRNPDRNVRRETSKMFLAALNTIATKLPSLYSCNVANSPQSEESFDDEEMEVNKDDKDLSVLQGTVVLLDYLWRHFQVHIKSWDEYFTLVLDVAKRGRQEVAQILAADYLARCLRIVSADAAMDLPSNFVRMLQNVYRRFATQPASYKAILALIDYLMRQLEPELSQGNIIETPEERLKHGDGEFPWTSAEVNLVHYHPEQQNASIFIEKLLTIDQADPSAHSILERLVRTGHHMDQRIFNTLRRVIQGDTTTEPLDPYMRAAPSFVDSTDSLDHAQRLIRHICAQAAGLQNSEGATFLEVFQALLDPQREEEEENRALRYYATTTMPDWAPYLLVYPDGRVRGDAERLLEQELFQPVMPVDSDSDDMAMEKLKTLGEIALRLGTLCIQYFQDAHVKRRAQIERDTATEMIQVIAKCSQYVEMSVTVDEDSKSEFKESRMEVMTALRHFIVDEVEDDVSDWEGSAFSSDAMDEAADTGTVEEVDQRKYAELMQGLSE